MTPSRDIATLLEIMARLRNPDGGCPWDLEQNFQTIAPYTVEEAHEVADAIARNDLADLCEELGDLLLQVVFHAQMAEEIGAFSFGDVVEAITRKMIRRHPHVFGDGDARTSGMVKGMWAKIKAEEKAERAERRAAMGIPDPERSNSLLGGVGDGLPAAQQALKIQEKAATVGFDWTELAPILAKIREEVGEIEAEIRQNIGNKDRIEAELGDVMFAVVNLARHVKLDPDQALRRTNTTFKSRFQTMERLLAESGRTAADENLEVLESLWQQAKQIEREG